MDTDDKVHLADRPAPEKRLEFEKFLADVSARLVALPPDRVDDEIRDGAKRLDHPALLLGQPVMGGAW